MSKFDNPNQFDAVLGTQAKVVYGSMILGGIEGVKQRLHSDSIQTKILALQDAMNYGTAGLNLAIEYLADKDSQVREMAYSLLELRSEPFVIEYLAQNSIRRYTRSSNRYDVFKEMGRQGTAENVDIMMRSLEEDPHSSPHKLIDYTLGLVNKQQGKDRIEYYLFNGTTVQRNYAALYFKRRNDRLILAQAVKLGCIDRVQAFSK
jgi:hypothetical protein